jgi:hypothetical protein
MQPPPRQLNLAIALLLLPIGLPAGFIAAAADDDLCDLNGTVLAGHTAMSYAMNAQVLSSIIQCGGHP